MQTFIVVKIHNQSLGKVQEVNSIEAALHLIKEWAEHQFERPLTNEENEELLNEYEIRN